LKRGFEPEKARAVKKTCQGHVFRRVAAVRQDEALVCERSEAYGNPLTPTSNEADSENQNPLSF